MTDEIKTTQQTPSPEAVEKSRIDAHAEALAAVAFIEPRLGSMSAHDITLEIARRMELPRRDWQEFAARAQFEHGVVLRTLRTWRLVAEEREEVAAEAERKRAREAAEAARQEAEAARLAAEEAEEHARHRQRLEAAQAKHAAEARAMNVAHKQQINGEVLAGLVQALVPVVREGGPSTDIGKAIVTAIATGRVPHVAIQY